MSKIKKDRVGGKPVDWNKYGLNESSSNESPQSPDSHSDSNFGSGCHVALEGNELFAQELVR